MASLHHRTKKELVDIMVALQQSYADTRTEAAASYRLQVCVCVKGRHVWCAGSAQVPAGWPARSCLDLDSLKQYVDDQAAADVGLMAVLSVLGAYAGGGGAQSVE